MRYGKRDWINYERGIEREWLITNGRSGFAGSTVIGANNRKYQGLLVACLTSPEERYMILNKLEESVTYEGISHPLTTTKYEKEIVEGYQNQQSFSYDGLPHYRYMINGAIIDKHIALEYEKNTVIVRYDISNNSKEGVLSITPFLVCRNPGECSKEDNLIFEKKFKRQEENHNTELEFIPQYNRNIHIHLWSTEGEFKEKEIIMDKVFYDIDKTTGDPYMEQLYKPGSYQIQMAPYEKKTIYIVCTLENEKIDPQKVFNSEVKRINKLRNTFNDNRLIA